MLLEENAHERLLNAPERHQKGNQELFKINSSIFLRSFIQSLTSFRHWVIPTHLQGVFCLQAWHIPAHFVLDPACQYVFC